LERGWQPHSATMIIRKARMDDIPAMLSLVNGYASLGVMLPRDEFELAESIRDFTVAEQDGRLLGCGALHFYTPTSAEVRSLAVLADGQGKGVGRRIVEALEQEALHAGLHSLFAFTYVPGFFRRLGFHEVDRGHLPLKAWRDCLRCPKFQCCDEVAVFKAMRQDLAQQMAAETGESQPVALGSGPFTFPILR